MSEFLTQLTTSQWVTVSCWVIFLLLSCFLFYRKSRFFGVSLFATAISIAWLFSGLFPFLFPWDEQFHALVAKNTGWNFLHPQLYPIHQFKGFNGNWASSYVWLHKPPLFTWQMAASVQVFGNTLFAVRFPSVLLFGFLSVATYDIGRIAFDRRAGFISALLITHAAYLLLLVSGNQGIDHNDLAFVAYTTFSVWAFFHFLNSNLRKWLIWIGIFAGCAILTKWLTGLLVFLPFGVWVLSSLRRKEFVVRLRSALLAFGVCLLVVLPWHIYTFIRFPKLAASEMQYNALHFSVPVEGHSGNFLYYYDGLSDLFFHRFDFLLVLVISLLIVGIRHYTNRFLAYMLLMIAFIFCFFSLAATKMPSFIVPAVPFVLVIIGGGISTLASFFSRRAVAVSVTVIATCILTNWMLHIRLVDNRLGISDTHEPGFQNYALQLKAYAAEHSLHNRKSLVFGFDGSAYPQIAWMYYEDDIVYPFYPSLEQLREMQHKGYTISLHESERLPEELKGLPYVRYLPHFSPK